VRLGVRLRWRQALAYTDIDAATRHALGVLDGDAQGRTRREDVLAHMAQEGWRDPRRGLLLRSPAIDLLERTARRELWKSSTVRAG
jgi:hypothetical protein